ncbi:MAG: InlB B-repeat-containing protein, partial [Petrotogales bacterium]
MKILKCNNLDKVSVNFITIIIIFASISIIFFTMPVRACHEVGTYESDYVTPKTTFLQGEIVYGKGTDIVPGHFKLRIRDPSNNIVNYSDPVYGKKVTCSWDLDDDAPIGEWNIQLGQYYKGSWHWSWTANFYVIAMSKYTLTININSDGIVTRDPDQETYNYGTLVNLTSYDNLGWSFSHWSGDLNGTENPTTINMTSNKTVTAHFTEDRYTLTINIKGSGTVNKDPFQQNYTYGTLVNLTANANPGWTFDHWGGDLNGSQNPENITMDDHKTVIAYFSENKGDGGEEQEEEEEGDHTDDSKTDKSSSGSYYSNQLPVSNASGPYSGAIGEEIEFDGSGSFDLDGTIT